MKYLKIAILFSLINAVFFGVFLAVLNRQNLKLDAGSATTIFESASQSASPNPANIVASSTQSQTTTKPVMPKNEAKPKIQSAPTSAPAQIQSAQSNRCIIIIKGQRYDVTDFRAKHPGGDIFVCGTDITKSFFSQHDQALLDGPIMSRMRVP